MKDFGRNVGAFYNWLADSRPLGVEIDNDFINVGYWYDDTETQLEASENLVNELISFIPEKEGEILEVGCGKGATARLLSNHYDPEQITGIDISEKHVEIAEENAPGCTFLTMDATKLDFDDESFHTIISVEAAVHFNTRLDFLREAYRVLKPGGQLVLADMVLSTRAPTQPLANYLRSTSAYESVCARAGFSEINVLDVTEECWDRFVDNFAFSMREKLMSREIRLGKFYGAMAGIRRMGTELYLIANCMKAT